MVYIIDDDRDFAECVARMLRKFSGSKVEIFSNGIEATMAMNDGVPDLIFLDVLLDGPDGFTFLNEMASYSDTERIPIVIMSSLNLQKKNLESYGVVRVLNKAEMVPGDVKEIVETYIG
ncbi:response regulator [Candidatus Saccharibacteria bacterium]|nr:response regulator [Candidatus Saccharibacteria bacterium]